MQRFWRVYSELLQLFRVGSSSPRSDNPVFRVPAGASGCEPRLWCALACQLGRAHGLRQNRGRTGLPPERAWSIGQPTPLASPAPARAGELRDPALPAIPCARCQGSAGGMRLGNVAFTQTSQPQPSHAVETDAEGSVDQGEVARRPRLLRGCVVRNLPAAYRVPGLHGKGRPVGAIVAPCAARPWMIPGQGESTGRQIRQGCAGCREAGAIRQFRTCAALNSQRVLAGFAA